VNSSWRDCAGLRRLQLEVDCKRPFRDVFENSAIWQVRMRDRAYARWGAESSRRRHRRRRSTPPPEFLFVTLFDFRRHKRLSEGQPQRIPVVGTRLATSILLPEFDTYAR
jgi:hypothetical protein